MTDYGIGLPISGVVRYPNFSMKSFAIYLACVLILAFMNSASADPLAVGSPAPSLTVTTHTGESLDLQEAYSSGPVLVYFYPKADTPGCTAQACNLRDHFAELSDKGITVIGVSQDSVEKQAAFRDKYELPFTLVADADKSMGRAFGVDSIPLIGAYNRQSFLVVDGKIAWRDLSASPKRQSQDALAALSEG